MLPNMHRKEYESLEEAPPFVREQLKEYIFWIKIVNHKQFYNTYNNNLNFSDELF